MQPFQAALLTGAVAAAGAALAALSSAKVHRALCAMALENEAESGPAVRSALIFGGLSLLCGFIAADILL